MLHYPSSLMLRLGIDNQFSHILYFNQGKYKYLSELLVIEFPGEISPSLNAKFPG